jgi:hypothetical protein
MWLREKGMHFALETQKRAERAEGIEKRGVRKSLFCTLAREERGGTGPVVPSE